MKHLKVFSIVLVVALLLAWVPAANAAPRAAVTCDQTYTVTAGDWLSKISDKFLGSVSAYWAIMAQTNKKNAEDPTFAKITNADQIEVGQKLCIPSKAEAEAFLKTFDPNNIDPGALFATGAKGQLVVGSWWTSAGEFAGLNEIYKLYKAANPDVEIVNAATAGGAGVNFKGQLLTKLIGGNPPDTFQLHAGLEVETYAPVETYLEPVDDIYASEGLDQVFPPDLAALLTYKGHKWGVPVNIHRSNVMWVNVPALQKAGLDKAPATWDEFFAAAEKLKAAGITPIAMGGAEGWEMAHTFEDILASTMGADGYRQLWTGERAWTDPGVTQALETFKKVLTYANPDRAAYSWPAAVDLVIQGKAAFHIMGDWANGEFTAKGKVAGVDYSWAPVPGTQGIFVGLSDMFALPKAAKNKENARAWIRLVGTKAAQEAFNPKKGSICARTDCDLTNFNDYLKSSAADWAKDKIVPSVVHGAAASPAWAKEFQDIITLFVTTGDVAAAQASLQQACVKAGVCK